MNLVRLIRDVVLPVAFLIGVAGCGNYPDKQYQFKGKINGESVEFSERNSCEAFRNNLNKLVVERTDGVQIIYEDIDGSNDLKIDSLTIISSEGELKYNKKDDKEVWTGLYYEAQSQFESYLQKIVEHKKQAGLQKLREKSIFREGN